MKYLLLTSLLFACVTMAHAQQVFINEIHYDNDGSDVNEGVEVFGPAGTDLSNYTLVAYNGNGGTVYSTLSLSDTIPNQQSGFGTAFFSMVGLQNGAPDGIALVSTDSVIQFLSYEGSFTAVGGAADGLLSTDIGISETSSTSIDFSMQLTGEGTTYGAFVWVNDSSSYGAINAGQIVGTITPVETLFINEIHYDNASTDAGEGVEVAGTAGLDLSNFSLVAYNGNGGTAYNTVNLSGTLPDQQNGYGTAFFAMSGLQNGAPDGVALISVDSVIQFLSYEGAFMATDGPASGMMSEDIGVVESGTTPLNFSLQLAGSGFYYHDFNWATEDSSTYHLVNRNQSFGEVVDPEPEDSTSVSSGVVFINEMHYDNASTDEGEAIEIAGAAGTDLTGWSLVLYNGNGGTSYGTTNLSGTIPNQDNGYGTLDFAISGIQNGAPDGVALVNDQDSVVQFLSYEGSFLATNGPAVGLMSEDIGVNETSSTPVGFSLQLTGTGSSYADFIWSDPISETFGVVNTGQSFGGVIVIPPVESDTVTVAQARTLSLGTEVVLLATLTATDQFGGPAYLQDSTAGIALFDYSVHGDSLFQIGDQLWISAEIGTFSNQIQLVNVDTVVLVGHEEVVPTLVTLSDLASYEGQLITIENASFDLQNGLLYPNANYGISDSTANAELRIDAEVNLVGRSIPMGSTTITGVLGRFQTTLQILPRFIPDLPDAEEYLPGGSDIPFENTIDIATWNMEFFGTQIPNYGPSDVMLQKQNAVTILQNLQADIIAVQEVSEESLLDSVVTELGHYQFVCSQVYSYSFQTPDPNDPFPPQKLCYIYDTTTVNYISDRVIFDQFYTDARTGLINDLDDHPGSSGASSFWSSGRLPYMLTAEVTVLGVTREVNLVNLHAKSGAGANDIARRKYDIAVLKDSLDAMYADQSVIILGDYNDDVDESIGGGQSSYQILVDDTTSYDIPTGSLSEAGFRSYLFADNMIDHITISDELFEDYIEDSETTLFPFHLVDNYANTTSDHLPVRVRFDFVEPISLTLSGETELFHGYEPLSSTTLSVDILGGTSPYTYLWSTGESTTEITVQPDVTTTYFVTIADASGQHVSDSLLVNVEDVSCGRYGEKVNLCWRGRKICVREYAVEYLLNQGATLGQCGSEDLPYIENLSIYPNPFYQDVTLSLTVNRDFAVKVTIYNFCGKAVFNETLNMNIGNNTIPINLGHAPRGFYILQLTNESTGLVEKRATLYKKQ